MGLYRASNVPGHTERDSVVYGGPLANPTSRMGRDGFWHWIYRDGLGRVRLAQTHFTPGLYRNDSTEYDLADRVVRTVSWGDTSHYSLGGVAGHIGADTLFVQNTYDAEGDLTRVARWVHPDSTQVDTVDDNFEYDEAGRKTSHWTTPGVDLSYAYDPAGHLTQVFSLLTHLHMQYDEMGHLVQRITDQATYHSTACTTFIPWGAASDCSFEFPLSTDGGTLTIPADTATFTYDAVGNLIRADNNAARIRRTYSPAGLVVTDSSFVRILRYATSGNAVTASDFTSHPYGIRYGYDQAGRLDSLTLPNQLDPCAAACPPERYT